MKISAATWGDFYDGYTFLYQDSHGWLELGYLDFSAPMIYVALAERGVIAPEALMDLRQTGCVLQGHPCMNKVPGIDMSTGSLGHGLSIGLGMALGAELKGKNFKVFVLLGDGELNEGQNWEAAMAAPKHALSNLIAIVDRNRVQLDGPTEEIMPLEPLVEMKLNSFRDKDRTHLRDLIGIELIDASWPARFPPELGSRLQRLLDDPDG